MIIFLRADMKYVLCLIFFNTHSPAVYDVKSDATFIILSESIKIDIFLILFLNIERLFEQDLSLIYTVQAIAQWFLIEKLPENKPFLC